MEGIYSKNRSKQFSMKPFPHLEPLCVHPEVGRTASVLVNHLPDAATVLNDLLHRLPMLQSVAVEFLKVYETIGRCFETGGTLFVGGNGGSHSDALHLTGELLKRFDRDRRLAEEERHLFQGLPYGEEVFGQLERGFRAVALGVNTAFGTAIENDFALPKMAFAQEIFVMGREKDALLAISTSGNARNLMYAHTAAKIKGMTTIALTGSDGGELGKVADMALRVPAQKTPDVQELHLPIYHALAAMLEIREFGSGLPFTIPGKGSVIPLERLESLVESLRRAGKRIVWTNGCFDLVHLGHITSLNAAKSYGDILIVGLNSDESVRAIKGPERPIVGERQRAAVLAHLTAVDYVTIFNDPTTVPILKRIKPDVYAKGGDYTLDTINPEERRLVESYGGEIAILPVVDGISTTRLVERFKKT